MPRKTFVYPHPINAYIIKQLGITVEEFCELHAFSQGTVSSWVTRNKKIETLPIILFLCQPARLWIRYIQTF